MRKVLHSSLLIAGIALAVGPVPAYAAVVLGDDFNDGVIGTQWIRGDLSCGAPTESGGQLVMAKTSSCAGGIQVSSDPMKRIRGDFEVVIDYDAPAFNVSGVLRVASLSVSTVNNSRIAVIERYNRQAGDGAPNAFNYKAWIDVSLNTSPAVAWAATSHISGKFRITRVGSSLSLAYWTGTAWTTLKSGSFSTDDVYIGLYTGSGGVTTAGWTVRWDNLVANAAAEVAPPEVCLSEDFSDGAIGAPWNSASTCGTVTETGGALRLVQGSCAGEGWIRMNKNQQRVCGDFDMAIDVRKIVMATPSSGGWLYAGLSLRDTTITSLANFSGIQFYNRFAPGDCAATANIKSFIGNPINCSPSVTRATSATAARLRVQRIGGFLRTYADVGGGWVQQRIGSYTTAPLLIELVAGSGTSGQSLTAEFDNLEVRCSVEDDGAPVVTAPDNATYACPADVPPLSASDATATAAHANGVVTVTATETVGGGIGSAEDPILIQRAFTATDLCMHSTTAIQTITVADGVAPSIVVPAALAPAAEPGIGPCPAVVSNESLGQATGEDNCGEVAITVAGVPEGNLFPEGETVLTWSASDAAGNVTTATQSVTLACPRSPVAGEVLRACNGVTAPAEGVAVELVLAGDVLAQATSGADGAWEIADVRAGTYVVRVGGLEGYAVPIDSRLVTVGGTTQTASVESFVFTCLLGDLAGGLTAACGPEAGPVHGVTIDLYREDSGGNDVLAATTSTAADGTWRIDDIALGDYSVHVVPPLGFSATPASGEASLVAADGLVTLADFALACQATASEPRSMGYWKHQVNVYLTGKGSAQESLASLLAYIDLIVERFNENPVHPVALYDAGVSGTNDRLRELQRLLTVNRGGTMNDRARQQLLALLLNVVSLKIAQSEVVTADGANVSQAITHCYDLVDDAIAANDETAKEIAEAVNEGGIVPAGRVPLTTPYIGYRDPGAILAPAAMHVFGFAGAWPNPSRGPVQFAFSLDTDAPVRVELYDVAGRRVATHTWEGLGPGRHALPLPGGLALRAGIYGVRLTHGDRFALGRLIRID